MRTLVFLLILALHASAAAAQPWLDISPRLRELDPVAFLESLELRDSVRPGGWVIVNSDSVPASWRDPRWIEPLQRLTHLRTPTVQVVSMAASYFPRRAPRTTIGFEAFWLLMAIREGRPYPEANQCYFCARVRKRPAAPCRATRRARRKIRSWYRQWRE